MKKPFLFVVPVLVALAILASGLYSPVQAGSTVIPSVIKVTPSSDFSWKAIYNDTVYGPGAISLTPGLYIAYGKVVINGNSIIGAHLFRVSTTTTLSWDWGEVHPAIEGSSLLNSVYPDAISLARLKAFQFDLEFGTLYAWDLTATGILPGITVTTIDPTATPSATHTPTATATGIPATMIPSPTASPTATPTATQTPVPWGGNLYLPIVGNGPGADYKFGQVIFKSDAAPVWMAQYEPNQYGSFSVTAGRLYLAVGTINGFYGVHMIKAVSSQSLPLSDGELIPAVSTASLDNVYKDAVTLAGWRAKVLLKDSMTLYPWTAKNGQLIQGIWK